MELLAPAGTYECVETAVNSGADAVYFAGQSFGARSFAGNLTDDEICRAADYCHLRGARAYVTVNTLTFDREFKELEKFIGTLTRAGVDGIIVQDLGVLRFVRELSPDMELHASTQMTVCAADGVQELERLGVSRAVLARELSAREIRDITRSVTAEIEVFVHGAMCMCYSGQCLMSSVIGGRSGNRGKCAQPCRLPYSADGREQRYYLSLKDMSLAEHLGELADMGVASLKIEGRMKGAEYVSAVVSRYRRLLDEGRAPTKRELEELNRVFFRGGLTDGYYAGDTGREMFAFDKPDNPYLKNDSTTERAENRRVPIEITARFAVGELPYISASCGGITAEAYGDDAVQTAKGRPLTSDAVEERLSKTGGTAFEAVSVKAELPNDAFVPVSQLNELRRRGVTALEDAILREYRNKRLGTAPKFERRAERFCGTEFTCSVCNMEQYRVVRAYGFTLIGVPAHIAAENAEELLTDRERIVLCPPVILRAEDRARYKKLMRELCELGFSKAEVSTVDGFEVADGQEPHGGHRLNITNSFAAEAAAERGLQTLCLSPEMNLAQIRDIEKPVKCGIIAYGRLPLMITENCVLKNIGKCPCGGSGVIYDRTGAEFPVIRDGDICRSVILNSAPLYAGDKLAELKAAGVNFLKLMFTVETGTQCKSVCEAYINGGDTPVRNYTRLQLFKGALA